jgi:hypothetical protein
VLSVSHLTGKGSTRNPWHVVVTDGEHFWHLEPDDVVRVDEGWPKPISQIDREIEEQIRRGKK